jgi:AraC family transcriptional regulator
MQTSNRHAVDCASEWRMLGGLRVREVRYAPGAHQPRHRHADGSLSLVLAGELTEITSAASCRAVAGSLVLKPAGYWHANTYGPRGARIAQVLPTDRSTLGDGDSRRYRWFEAPRLARKVIGLLRHRSGRSEFTEMAMWEAIDGLMSPTAANQTGARPGWWADAVDLLDECVEQPISVADVARRVGVHPVHLARVCRRQLGCTVREYIRGRRVLAAWRAWERGSESLAAIACHVGFADQAHMTRAFAAVLGVSPGRLRRLAALPPDYVPSPARARAS